MKTSVSVLCVLCVFVVKNPLSVALLHRTRMAAARKSSTPCLLGVRYSFDGGYQYGAFSTLCAAPISVGRFPHANKNSKDNFQCHQMSSSLSSTSILAPLAAHEEGFQCGSM